MSKVAVLGTGAMGSRMAARLADAGHTVTVWNRTPERATTLADRIGATTAPTPRVAVDGVEAAIAMVADDEASHVVWLDETDGALGGLAGGALAIEASTITPGAARALGRSAAATGHRLVEAPVVGSRPQAEAGALVSLAGGDPDDVAAAEPLLSAYSGSIRHLGPIGAAATTKLAVNGWFGVQVAALSEIVGVLERSEVDTATAIELLGALPVTSPGLARILGLVAERHFEPNFPIGLVAKDFGYLDRLAAELGAPVPLVDTTAAVFADAAADERVAGLDIAGIASRYLPD